MRYEQSFASLMLGALLLMTVVSSLEMAQYPHGTVIAPWQFSSELLFLIVVSFIGFFFFTLLFPNDAYRVLLVAQVFAAGVFFLRFPMLDELILFVFVSAVFTSNALKPERNLATVAETSAWDRGFLLLLFYLTLLALIGLVFTGNVKAVRFLLLFLSLWVLAYFFIRCRKPIYNEDIIKDILFITLFYFLTNVLINVVLIYTGFFQEVFEGIGNAGSAYQFFINILAIPCAFVSIALNRNVGLSFSVIALSLLVGVFGDSRAAVLPILLCTSITVFFFPSKRVFLGGAVIVLAVSVAGAVAFRNPLWIIDTVASAMGALDVGGVERKIYYGEYVESAKGDTGRLAYAVTPFFLWAEQPWTIFTGLGSYSFFPVAYDSFLSVLDGLGSPALVINQGTSFGGVSEPPRPPAFGAFLVEYGLLGFALLLYCVFKACSYVIRRCLTRISLFNFGLCAYFLVIPASALLWMYFGEIQDVVLFFFIFAPFGVLKILVDQVNSRLLSSNR